MLIQEQINAQNLAKYKTASLKASATKQALEVAQDLGAKFVISTDSVNSQWYSAFDNKPILNIDGSELKEVFGITTCNTPKIEKLIELLDSTINKKCRQITQIQEVDPTPLAYAIWQKIYKATTATPENCLYTFVEIFIFKYLSDLNILDELYQYNTLLGMYRKSKEDNVLSYYTKTIRPEIKKLFPDVFASPIVTFDTKGNDLSDEITGNPHASASIIALQHPSELVGKTNISLADK